MRHFTAITAVLLAYGLLCGCGATDTYNPTFSGSGRGFRISATPPERTISYGDSTTFDVATTSFGGFDGPINLKATGMPSGWSMSIAPSAVNPVDETVHSELTVWTGGYGKTRSGGRTSGVTGESYPITITGTSGTETHSTTVQCTVVGAESTFTLDVQPPSRDVMAGASTTYTVTLTSVNGFGAPVSLSVAGLPNGDSGSFTVNPVTPTSGGATSTLNVTTSSTVSGTFPLTVTASGGGVTRQAQVTLHQSGYQY